MKKLTPYLLIIFAITACQSNKEKVDTTSTAETALVENPAAEGFNLQSSDPTAIKIADDVMSALGGRNNWDNTRCLSWNFFGARKLYWDKLSGDVRIKYLRSDMEAIVNINTGEGRIMKDGVEMTDTDSLQKYLKRAKGAWINDSYWLVMPYKLKDSGVTLRFIDEDSTMDGRRAYLLDLNFEDVGVTPENYYQVWVDLETKLVSQWAYYKEATQDEPNFVMPWKEYKDFGKIKLSGNRGERQLTDIQVHESFPETFFSDFSPMGI